MNLQEIRDGIQKLLNNYTFRKEGLFYIEGNAKGLWFIMHNVNFSNRFNKSKTGVMVRFKNNCDWPEIFVPNDLNPAEDSNVCPFLFEKSTSIQGWKPICTIMLHYIEEDFFIFVPSFGEFLANPRVCYPLWCEEQRAEQKKIEMYCEW